RDAFVAGIIELLEDIQGNLLSRAKAFRDSHTRELKTEAEFIEFFTPKNAEQPEIHGGFASVGFCCEAELEDRIAKEHKVTVRCIPNETRDASIPCVFTGKPGKRVIFAKSY
ncbi:MAG: proline--tRNA ligase, partial [Opitutales bacterium]